jgi:hypothetical protein
MLQWKCNFSQVYKFQSDKLMLQHVHDLLIYIIYIMMDSFNSNNTNMPNLYVHRLDTKSEISLDK